MSRYYRSIATLVFLVAIGLAAKRADENSASRGAVPRAPSALASKKELQSKGGEASMFRHTEKLQGSLHAELSLSGPAPEKPGDTFALKATITATENLNDVDFKWSLPGGGVELVNGQLKGQISAVGQEKPAEVQITLKTLTGENHQVHLIVSATNHGAHFAQSVQYNTILEPVLADSRRQLEKSTKGSARDSASEGKPTVKVFH